MPRVTYDPAQPSAELVAEAFDLGRPTAPLALIQHTVARSWRLDTKDGPFHIKQFWPDEDPFWAPQLTVRMEFERRALEAGIMIPRPIQPVEAAYAWAGRVGGAGAYRAYEWVDNRALDSVDDVTEWLGAMLAQLHAIEPMSAPPDLAWRWFVSHPREVWQEWIAAGAGLGKAWVPIARARLDDLIELSTRDDRAFVAAADHVTTHRDIEPYNVIMAASGPMLIDWDSVGPESATIETGHAAVTFGYGDAKRIQRILHAYRAAGGRLAPLGPDLLIRTAARQLSDITGLIRTTIGLRAPAGWMTRLDADQRIAEWLQALPKFVAYLDRCGRTFAG